MASSAIHSPSKFLRTTFHKHNDWTALQKNPSRETLMIFNKGEGPVGVGIGTAEADGFITLKPNGFMEFLPGNVPTNYIYLNNNAPNEHPEYHVVVISNVDEIEGYPG